MVFVTVVTRGIWHFLLRAIVKTKQTENIVPTLSHTLSYVLFTLTEDKTLSSGNSKFTLHAKNQNLSH